MSDDGLSVGISDSSLSRPSGTSVFLLTVRGTASSTWTGSTFTNVVGCTQWSSECPAGTYYSAAGTSKKDVTCTTCLGTAYYAAGPSPAVGDDVATQCSAAISLTCPQGTYFSQAATAIADRVCSPCAAGTWTDPGATTPSFGIDPATRCANLQSSSCFPGYYYSAAANGTSDRGCTPCESGTYSAAGMRSVFGSSKVNAPCSSLCTEAGPGQRVMTRCTTTANAQLAACADGTYSVLGSETNACRAVRHH
jgi:hypothetical protein